MNEFLIWDMEINKPVVVATIEDYIDVNFKDRCKAFRDIGLKDINRKSIYADSSIVEFQWINSFGNVQTDWGVFKYDIDYLQYLIYEENEDINKSSIKDVLNIKIIDTIQENKLGLIKA